MSKHCIAVKPGYEAPMAPEILGVVDKVLSHNLSVRMSKHLSKALDNRKLFLWQPISFGSFDAHEGNAEGTEFVEGKSDASDVPATSLNVTGDGGWPLFERFKAFLQIGKSCRITGAQYEGIS